MSSVWLSPELNAIRAGRMPKALAAGHGLSSLWSAAPMERIVLRRSGDRPLSFTGMVLLSHENVVDDHALRRHAIRLYETQNGAFIVEIALFCADSGILRHSVATEVTSLDDAELFLSAYDPAGQAALALIVDEPGMDAFSIGTMADCLRADAERLRQDYNKARDAVFAAARNDDHDSTQRVN
jgi:hypothetical protein